ncbi:MAG: thiamine pyrophosphate-dependent dehydrogenase E1 component subunit alpha, partial [Verrucomicrobiota bacterium]
MPSLDNDQKLRLLEMMSSSREGDRREGILYRQGNGWFQIASVGHEALSAIALNLRPDDYLFPHYRDRALVMMKGMDTRACARGFWGKFSSTSGGRQLPGHFSSRKDNIWSMPSPTGSNLLPACGAAWGMQLDGLDTAVVACVGDAGMRQGEFYEAFTLAVQMKLPVVFVIEDNRFGISTSTVDMNPLRLGVLSESYISQVDGRNAEEVYVQSEAALRKARAGKGPTILWCELDRLCSHSSSDDQRQYVSEDELSQMDKRDPISRLENDLISSGVITVDHWEERKKSIVDEIAAIYDEVAQEDDPTANDLIHEVIEEVEAKDEVV